MHLFWNNTFHTILVQTTHRAKTHLEIQTFSLRCGLCLRRYLHTCGDESRYQILTINILMIQYLSEPIE